MDKRITDLEIKVAYQDKLLSELNDVLVDFCQRVQNLEAEIRRLRDTATGSPQLDAPADSKPPHY